MCQEIFYQWSYFVQCVRALLSVYNDSFRYEPCSDISFYLQGTFDGIVATLFELRAHMEAALTGVITEKELAFCPV